LHDLNHNRVIIDPKRAFLQEDLGGGLSLIRVTGQDALIKRFSGRKRWPVAKHDIEEFKAFRMSADNDQAQGERC
jgi:hypothetical protein